MLSIETEARIARIFVLTAQFEKKIEVTRQVLAEQEEFEPNTSFLRIDSGKDGLLDVGDIQNFLSSNKVEISPEDIQIFINVHDKDRDGCLNFEEFLLAMLPLSSSSLRKIAISRQIKSPSQRKKLPYDVEYALMRIIEQEVTFQRALENLRVDLAQRHDFNLMDAYNSISFQGPEYPIDFETLDRFIKRNGETLFDDDILNILRRFDLDQDAKISFQEFSNAVLPAQSQQRLKRSYISSSQKSLRSSDKKRVHQQYLNEGSFSFQSPGKSNDQKQQSQPIHSQEKGFRSTETKLDSNYQVTPVRLDYKDQNYKNLAVRAQFTTPLKSTQKKKQHTLSPKNPTQESTEEFYFSFNQQSQPLDQTKEQLNEKYKENFLKKDNNIKWPERSPQKMEVYEEDEVARSLKEFISLDKELESIKQMLSLKTDFNLEDCYRLFDKDEKGYVTFRELQETYGIFSMYPKNEGLELMMKKYDKDQDGKLKFQEFCEALKPKDKNYASLLINRKAYNSNFDYQRQDPFLPDTKQELKSLLLKFVNDEIRAERIRQHLKQRKSFDLSNAFKSLDQKEKGYINKQDLSVFLEKSHYFATEKELFYLLQRFDQDGDGVISFSEFVLELTPRILQ